MSFGGRAYGGRMPTRPGVLRADELQEHMRESVGLGQHGGGGLSEDLVADEGGHFGGHVHIGDAGLGGEEVLRLYADIGDGVLQPVLHGTEVGAYLILSDDGIVQPVQGLLGELLRLDGDDVAIGIAGRHDTAAACRRHGRPISGCLKATRTYN